MTLSVNMSVFILIFSLRESLQFIQLLAEMLKQLN